MHFFLIAILKFLPYKPEPELTNLRGKITKGSTFESDWMCKKIQCFSFPYPLKIAIKKAQKKLFKAHFVFNGDSVSKKWTPNGLAFRKG